MKKILYLLIFTVLCGILQTLHIHNELMGISYIVLIFLWMPYIDDLHYMNTSLLRDQNSDYYDYYTYSNRESMKNPLWVKGYWKRKREISSIFSKNISFSRCRFFSIVLMMIMSLYLFLKRKYDFYYIAFEILFIICSLIIIIVWFVYINKYMKLYRSSYEYTENDEGIWLPFRFITEQPGKGKEHTFRCWYHQSFSELKEYLIKKTKEEGYRSKNYDMDKEKDITFFIRENGEVLWIFELIHMKIFKEEDLEILNEIFIKFWKNNLQHNESLDSIRFMFLICVDEKTNDLKDTFLNYSCIQQKDDRNRLAAVLLYDDKDLFTIIANNRQRKCYSEYCMMRRELMDLLGIGFEDKEMDCYFDGRMDSIKDII